jgi:serine/threonine protein phosphatase 1
MPRKTASSPPHTRATPEGERIYAIGDIHGRVDLLRALLAQIGLHRQAHPGWKDELLFLGDYVDRGLNSKEVLDLLSDGLPNDSAHTFLRGNHDDAMLRFLRGQLDIASGWLHFGGRATLASYGLQAFGQSPNDDWERVHAALRAAVPERHIAFLRSTLASCTRGDYYFVHAGVRPGIPLSRQDNNDKLWIRNDFLTSSYDFGKTIVHGHTVEPKPVVRPNRIGIDTGAFATGHLTCLILYGTHRKLLQT